MGGFEIYRYKSSLLSLFMIDLDKTENTCVCFSIIKIEPNFRSLFYHDSIIKIFCSREQSTSYVHAHTFIELKKKKKEKKEKLQNCEILTKFLRNVLWRSQGSLLCYFWVFLCRCFDQFRRVRLFSRSVHVFM